MMSGARLPRPDEENDMFNWLRTVLHWRSDNEVITRGSQVQFIPYGGVYVLARSYGGKTVLTVVNGNDHAASLAVKRYSEVIGACARAVDVPTGRTYDLTRDIELEPRGTLILTF